MRKLFVSCRPRDVDLARRLSGALSSHGMSAFLADDIAAGADWRARLREAAHAADAFIVVLTSPEEMAWSITGYVIGMAEGLGKPVVVLLSNLYPPSTLPFELRSYRVVSFDPQHPEDAAPRVADDLSRLAAA